MRRKYPLLTIYLFFTCCLLLQLKQPLYAQLNVDSLLQLMKTDTSDTLQFNGMLKLSREGSLMDPDSSLRLLGRAKKILLKNYYILRAPSPALRADTAALKRQRAFYMVAAGKYFHHLASAYERKSDLFTATDNYLFALRIWDLLEQRDSVNRMFYYKFKTATYNNLGTVYRKQSRYPQALDCFFRGLEIDEQLKSKKGMSSKFNNIGIIYENTGNFDLALDYYNRSIAIKKELGDKKGTGITLTNIAAIYVKKQDFTNALRVDNEALQLARETKNRLSEAIVLGNIGNLYTRTGRYPEALKSLEEALAIDQSLGNTDGIRLHTGNIGNLYLEWKKYAPAEKYLLEALRLSEEAGDLQLIVSFSLPLSEMYGELGKAKKSPDYLSKSLAYYKQYAAAADSLSNEEKAKEQVRVEMNYEFGKKEAENRFRLERQASQMLRITKEKEISDLKLEQELVSRRYFIIILVSALVVLGILSLLLVSLVRTMRERKKAFTRLEEKNVEIKEQGKLLVMQSKALTRYQAQMNPHFIFNALNSIQGFVVNNEREKTLTQLQAFSKLMRQTLSNSDRETISLETELHYLALYIAFEQERFSQHIRFVKNIAVDETDIEIPPMLIQPFIENALKHAGFHETAAPQITLGVREEGRLLRVEISDNGKGITGNMETVEKQSHAISIIRSRIRLLFENEQLPLPDVLLELRSVPAIETGTTVIFFIPLITKF